MTRKRQQTYPSTLSNEPATLKLSDVWQILRRVPLRCLSGLSTNRWVSEDLEMTNSAGADQSAHKLLGARGVKLRVAAGSICALGLGIWLTPPARPTTLSAPQERAAPLLEEQVQLREVVKPFRGVQEITARVRRFGVAIPDRGRTPIPVVRDFSIEHDSWNEVSFGVVVSEAHVLTHTNALAGRELVSVATVDGTHEMRVAAYDPATNLVLLRSASPDRTTSTDRGGGSSCRYACGCRSVLARP